MNTIHEQSLKWNNYHLNILNSNKAQCITKIGSTEAIYISEFIKTNGAHNKPNAYDLSMACGVHFSSHESQNKWCEAYIKGIRSSDYLHLWHEDNFLRRKNIPDIQNRLDQKWTDSFIYNSFSKEMNLLHEPSTGLDFVIMPFGLGEAGWHKKLSNKKILAISSSEKSFRYQAERYDKIWSGAKIKDFDFVKIPSSEHLYKKDPDHIIEWDKKVEKAKNEICKKDFDFAMLGCGGIGLILVDFIKNELNKSCTYLGGTIQLFFGIRGGRWESIKNNWYNSNDYWIKPFKEDIPKHYKVNEGGCYWVT